LRYAIILHNEVVAFANETLKGGYQLVSTKELKEMLDSDDLLRIRQMCSLP
jgi:hypothetical protein